MYKCVSFVFFKQILIHFFMFTLALIDWTYKKYFDYEACIY